MDSDFATNVSLNKSTRAIRGAACDISVRGLVFNPQTAIKGRQLLIDKRVAKSRRTRRYIAHFEGMVRRVDISVQPWNELVSNKASSALL